MTRLKMFGVLGAIAGLAACSSQDEILEGERLAVREPFLSGNAAGAREISTVFRAPSPAVNSSWTHASRTAEHNAGHPAFAQDPVLVWSVEIGSGNSRKHRITASPIVAGNMVFTLDSRSHVSAVSTEGKLLWTRDLTPGHERNPDASGGGIAYADGRIFATTGFGEMIALNAENGAEFWRQRFDAPAAAGPVSASGLVYAVSRDNIAWAVDARNGRVRWKLQGTPALSGVVGGAAPAVTERIAVFPFGTGELIAVLRKGGVRLWGAPVSGRRRGPVYATITDIIADPVVVGDVIYSGNQSGRTVAINLDSGDRIWTARHGAYGPVAAAGNSVFLISDQSKLIRLEAETGREVWAIDLPFFRSANIRRKKAIFAHYGPVLAGGRLWVASDAGTLKSYDPETGAEQATVSIPEGAASSMAVAGKTMYLLSSDGRLHAFR